MRQSICIISFSPIYRDARVLRQIRFLSDHYHLKVVGYGEPHLNWGNIENTRWEVVKEPVSSFVVKIIGLLLLALGRLSRSLYDYWYWRKKHHQVVFKMAIADKSDAYHANDWEALPAAAQAAKINRAKLVFDAHEYAPLELENRWYWKVLFKPAIIYFIKKYAPQVDASLTVAPLISERYKQEFGLNTIVVLNTPERVSIPNKKIDFNHIRLIHHGGAIRDRRIERMIKTLALCNQRFTLHFMLINNDIRYLNYLNKLANGIAPARVVFHEPVAPEEIVKSISEYDMGFYLLEPNSYNNRVALPNKFFDFIAAGLAVCIGPSPSMEEMVRQYGFGCVAPSFNPHDVADMLNNLTKGEIARMCLASREASQKICAEIEMGKLVELYNESLGSSR